MKEVGRLWSQIKEDSLSIYREQARLDLERYKKEHEEFVTIINLKRQEAFKKKNNQPSSRKAQEVSPQTSS